MNTASKGPNDDISAYVPTKKAYLVAWLALLVSGITGGFIGFALVEVFIPSFEGTSKAIATLIVLVAIMLSINVLVSLALQASVEWKARQKLTKSKLRPSRFLQD